MAKKSSSPHFAPLQRVVAEPITEAAEQAALDEQRRRLRDEDQGDAPRSKAAARVLSLCRQLSAKERLALLTQLASQVSSDRQLELLERLLIRLPPQDLQQLEEKVTPRLHKRAT
jgi:hypothetical protein